MIDERAEKLANLVLNYSVELNKNDRLMIQFDPAYGEYAKLISDLAKRKGAKVRFDSMSYNPKVLRALIKRNDLKEWTEDFKRRLEISKWCTARILIDADSNPNYAEGIQDSEERVAEFHKIVVGPYKKVLYRPGDWFGTEVKWNIVGFPCKESAKTAGMSLNEYTNFVYKATLENDWEEMSKKMQVIKQAFDFAEDVHIIVSGLTDLHLSLRDRGSEICDGHLNMPDGEVFYGPVEDSIEGKIYFQCPTRYNSGIIQGIDLEFEKGVIKKASAKQNEKALLKTLDIDEGAKRVGELGIGCNYAIKRTILETLFDEKIGGTIHLALGDSYKQALVEGGGLNNSAIHWDIVCDLRRDSTNLQEFPGGELYIDNQLVQKDGVWKI